MAYGVLIESSIQAKDIDALNRSAVGTIAVAGAGLVAVTAPTTQGEDRWTITAPATGALGSLWMAYNPSAKYITTADGLQLAGVSADPRAYTNPANKSLTIFKPKVGDEIVVTVDAVESASQAAVVAGDFLESKNAQTTFTRIASATGATAGSTSFRVEYVGTLAFPKAGVGIDYVKTFKAVCVQE